MNKLKALIIALGMFLFIAPVSAKEIEHFYFNSDTTVSNSDTINASAALAGQKVEVKGEVKGALFGAGNNVTFSGTTDYLLLAGNTVDISGKILKDSAIAGSSVNIKGATFERDLAVAAGSISATGKFNRDATLSSSLVELNDITVVGDLHLYANEINIGKNVKIEGTLSYPEDAKITIDDSAVIGNTVKTDSLKTTVSFVQIITEKVFSLLSLVLIFLVISLLVPKVFKKIDEKYEVLNFEKVIEAFTKGLLVLIVIPIIAIILLSIVVGMPLAFILIAIYAIAIYLSKIFAAYLIGSKIAGKWMKKETSILVKGLIGLAIVFVIGIIPYVSVIAAPIILFIGLGLIFDAIRK